MLLFAETGRLNLEGCTIYPICNVLPNRLRFVTDRKDLSPFVSSQHVSDRVSSSTLVPMFVVSLF